MAPPNSDLVERLDREVFGNGSPGLAKQMAAVKVKVGLGIWLLGLILTTNVAVLIAVLNPS